MKFYNKSLVNNLSIALFALFSFGAFAQSDVQTQDLEEVIVSSSRIDLPLSENSRTIKVIHAEEIQKSAATSLADLLQTVAGVDIRRRGAQGMQADLYIRGGSFDQTLLLIDGIKVDDPQTGHHTMNIALPIELIERIEIVKGPSARVFGQNAFTGAINIVTKKSLEGSGVASISGGSFGQKNGSLSLNLSNENVNHIIHISKNTSEGYRHNTDFDNFNAFYKSDFKMGSGNYTFQTAFSDRAFGANGFYASPSATEQYEETQASLVTLYGRYQKEDWVYKPSLFWKRNQDEYIYIRDNPSIYRNLHISNKVGVALNASKFNSIGTTGYGLELAQVFIASNNLGGHERLQITGFLEQQLLSKDEKIDITPGIAFNYYSDFKFHAFPGVDLGIKLSEGTKVYANVGYTYRIPTYTDLYYASSTTLGNENLNPETAFSQEYGAKFDLNRGSIAMAYFIRNTDNLIDYVKYSQEAKWEANNFAALSTKGFEFSGVFPFDLGTQTQQISLAYTYINDDIKDVQVPFSRYAINSLKHQVVLNSQLSLLEQLPLTLTYTYAERTKGTSYNVLDASISYQIEQIKWSLVANNILDAEYSETNLVPAPGANVMIGLSYILK
jgi:iron complex outermembrane receptor protein